MTSNRPYLIRALYEWIVDNNMTPHLLVDASNDDVRVPPNVVKDGKVVLNAAPRAVQNLDLGNQRVTFSARFSGASFAVDVPVVAVQAVYARETGQGMMFPENEHDPVPPEGPDSPGDSDSTPGDGGKPHLRVVK